MRRIARIFALDCTAPGVTSMRRKASRSRSCRGDVRRGGRVVIYSGRRSRRGGLQFERVLPLMVVEVVVAVVSAVQVLQVVLVSVVGSCWGGVGRIKGREVRRLWSVAFFRHGKSQSLIHSVLSLAFANSLGGAMEP
jgi:hypothetical protein